MAISVATFAGAFMTVLLVVTSWTPADMPSRVIPALMSLVFEGGTALLWWVGATGIGLWVVGWGESAAASGKSSDARTAGQAEVRTSLETLLLGVAVGAAALLFLASTLGSLGVLVKAGGALNWVPLGVGVFLLVRVLRDAPLDTRSLGVGSDGSHGRVRRLAPPIALGAILALFVAAAASPPGWLWSSEFKGYDALSYHLELPKEWILAGQPTGPVDGNVYSALPSFVESAFLQLMLMRGSVVQGALTCQFWSMFAALATAALVGQLAGRVIDRDAGPTAMLALLALPWTLVVGTLAYNDMIPGLMLAAAWLLLERAIERDPSLRAKIAALLALLAAAAVGAKPTALFFMALPLLAIVVLRAGTRALRLAPLVVAVAIAVLAPWLIRNQLAYGNAIFPFGHGLLGAGPWSEEQFAIFAAGHGPDRGFFDRVPLLWSQWLAHGTGAAPGPNEPWFPQWGLLPLGGIVGLAIGARRSAHARAALAALAIAVAGWMLFTHLKSRFLLPTAVPLALGLAMLLSTIARATQPLVSQLLLAPMLALPFVVYWREPATPIQSTPDSPPELLRGPATFIGDATFFTGERFARDIESATAEMRPRMLQQAPVTYFLNYALPDGARVIAAGYSAPFYVARRIEWNTVWDRGPLDQIAREAPGDPTAWRAKLHALGFTHLVIDPTMLSVWARSGWINPDLAPDRWLGPLLQTSRRVRTGDGRFIVDLTEALPTPAVQAPPATPSSPAATPAGPVRTPPGVP